MQIVEVLFIILFVSYYGAIVAKTSPASHNNVNHEDDLASAGEDFQCDRLPPAFWCSCEKVQAKCGFQQQCQAYDKASREKKIQVTLLYESLCPDCQQFIERQLVPVYANFKEHLDLELVPFGNARKHENGTIECQHGKAECAGNKYESCAIHFMSEPLPFIACVERLLAQSVNLEKAAKKCYAAIHTIPHIYDQIIHCFNGALGDRLQLEAADRTAAAWPDQHEFVPWILINNASLESAQSLLLSNLQTVLCQSLLTENPPAVCQLSYTYNNGHSGTNEGGQQNNGEVGGRRRNRQRSAHYASSSSASSSEHSSSSAAVVDDEQSLP